MQFHFFNILTRISKSKNIKKHIITKHNETLTSCECKCNSNQKRNNDKCRCEYKNPRKHLVCEKDYIWNPSTCTFKNDKYTESTTDDSVITCDKIADTVRSEPTKISINFNIKKIICNVDNFYIQLTFFLFTILLLIVVGIYYYYYHTKHQSKQILKKYYHSINKLKEINTTNTV